MINMVVLAATLFRCSAFFSTIILGMLLHHLLLCYYIYKARGSGLVLVCFLTHKSNLHILPRAVKTPHAKRSGQSDMAQLL